MVEEPKKVTIPIRKDYSINPRLPFGKYNYDVNVKVERPNVFPEIKLPPPPKEIIVPGGGQGIDLGREPEQIENDGMKEVEEQKVLPPVSEKPNKTNKRLELVMKKPTTEAPTSAVKPKMAVTEQTTTTALVPITNAPVVKIPEAMTKIPEVTSEVTESVKVTYRFTTPEQSEDDRYLNLSEISMPDVSFNVPVEPVKSTISSTPKTVEAINAPVLEEGELSVPVDNLVPRLTLKELEHGLNRPTIPLKNETNVIRKKRFLQVPGRPRLGSNLPNQQVSSQTNQKENEEQCDKLFFQFINLLGKVKIQNPNIKSVDAVKRSLESNETTSSQEMKSVDLMNDGNHPRRKRSLSDIAGSLKKWGLEAAGAAIVGGADALAFAFGGPVGMIVVHNLVTGIVEKFNPESNTNRMARLEEDAQNFEKKWKTSENVTQEILKTATKFEEEMYKNFRKLKDDIHFGFQNQFINNVIMNRIQQGIDNMARVVRLYNAADELDVSALVSIFDLDVLDDLLPSDTHVVEMRASQAPSKEKRSSIHIKFLGRHRSKDTKVYSAHGFSHWDQIGAGKPKFVKYTGEKYLIYNKTSNCIKSITPPLAGEPFAIQASCPTKNGKDSRLNSWESVDKATSLEFTRNKYDVKENNRATFVYCFPNNITMNNETYLCPNEVIQLPLWQSFNVGDYHHHGMNVSASYKADWMKEDFVEHHFTDEMDVVNQHTWYKSSLELHKQLEEADKELKSYPVTSYWSKFFIICAGVAMIMNCFAITYCCCDCEFLQFAKLVKRKKVKANTSSMEMRSNWRPPITLTQHMPSYSVEEPSDYESVTVYRNPFPPHRALSN